MKYWILLFALCLGILVGITLFAPIHSMTTGAAIQNCYVENHLCECAEKECICGNNTVPIEYCT